jgi:hypothetical protein
MEDISAALWLHETCSLRLATCAAGHVKLATYNTKSFTQLSKII